MRFTHLLSASVLACACTVAASPAMAAAQAGASIFDFHFTVTDLDASDGVDAVAQTRVPFALPTTGVFAIARDLNAPAVQSQDSGDVLSNQWFAPASAEAATANAFARAETKNAAHSVFASASGDSWARAVNEPLDPFRYATFLLSANTEVRLTGWFSAYAFATGDDTSYVTAHFAGSDFTSNQSFDQVLRAGGGNGPSANLLAPFEFVLRNDADNSNYAVLRLGFEAGANVTAVPEPQTYALMLSGLALIGVAARRRLRRPLA